MDKGTAKLEVEKLVKKFLSIPKSELDDMKEEQIKFRFIVSKHKNKIVFS